MKEIVNNNTFTVENLDIKSYIDWKKNTQTWIAYNRNNSSQVYAKLIANILKPGSFEIISFEYEANYKSHIEQFIIYVENDMNTKALSGMLKKEDILFKVTFDEKEAEKSTIIKTLFPQYKIPEGEIHTYQYKFM